MVSTKQNVHKLSENEVHAGNSGNRQTFAEPCRLYLNGSNIEHVTDFKLLGITLDQDLSLNRQIEELCKKLAKRIGLLRHISPYLKRNQRDIY